MRLLNALLLSLILAVIVFVDDVHADPGVRPIYYSPSAPIDPSFAELLDHEEFSEDLPDIEFELNGPRKLSELRNNYHTIMFPAKNRLKNRVDQLKIHAIFPDEGNAKSKPLYGKLLVIYPTIMSKIIAEDALAFYARKLGMTVIIPEVFDFPYKEGDEALPDLNMRTVFGVQAVKSFLDFIDLANERQDIKNDPKNLASKFVNIDSSESIHMGLSNGTVAATMVAETDVRAKALAVIMPIANVPGVMATTTNKKLGDLRDHLMPHYGLQTPQEYATKIREHLIVDSVDVLGHRNSVDKTRPLKYMVVTSDNDDTVNDYFQNEYLNRLKAQLMSSGQGLRHLRAIKAAVNGHARGILAEISLTFFRNTQKFWLETFGEQVPDRDLLEKILLIKYCSGVVPNNSFRMQF